jgi:hypothetical protein
MPEKDDMMLMGVLDGLIVLRFQPAVLWGSPCLLPAPAVVRLEPRKGCTRGDQRWTDPIMHRVLSGRKTVTQRAVMERSVAAREGFLV